MHLSRLEKIRQRDKRYSRQKESNSHKFQLYEVKFKTEKGKVDKFDVLNNDI